MRSMYDIQAHNHDPLTYWKNQLKVATQINNKEMVELSKRMILRYEDEEGDK